MAAPPPNRPAGLSYAPPYDPSQELDPSKVKAVNPSGFDVQTLEYFRDLQEKRVGARRGMLVILGFMLLGINIWLTQRNYEAVVINVDQARLAQAEMDERSGVRFSVLNARIDELEKEVVALRAAAEAPPAE